MTERIYHRDSHCMSCTATVEKCEKTESGWTVVLDRTVLFENAGGQPADTGYIGEARVSGSDEIAGELVVSVDRPLTVGKEYTVTVDAERRLDLMRQHTGEHLLSWAFYKLFGINNVGFHLAEDYATIDLDAVLTDAQVEEAERLANDIVMQNRRVGAVVYETEEAFEAAGLALRKQSEKAVPPIRIVSIEGADVCTCCAPHCDTTGEIGLILVTDRIKWKSGNRLTFLCGGRALRLVQREHRMLDTVARGFSVARTDVLTTVEKREKEASALRKREKELTGALDAYLAKDLKEKAVRAGKTMLIAEDLGAGYPAERVRSLAIAATAEKDALTLLFGNAGGKLAYAVCVSKDSKIDAGEIAQAVNPIAGTKGGGRGTLAQGTGPVPEGFDSVLSGLRSYLMNRLK
ncbi:MAG: DHHA1 domain-containing protein [Clostridia bacterium]|nr:DHHA1 domain-containing protein [Clostridia bacterium]